MKPIDVLCLHDHLDEERPDLVLNRHVVGGAFDEAGAVDVELGEMSIHDVFTIDGSDPNRSPRRPAGVAIRCMPATSLFDRTLMQPSARSRYHVDFSTRPPLLLRGKDRAGKDDFFDRA